MTNLTLRASKSPSLAERPFEVITGPRCSGKTTQARRFAEQHDAYFVIQHQGMAKAARKQGVKVLSYEDITGPARGEPMRTVVIDNADLLLRRIFPNLDILGVSMTVAQPVDDLDGEVGAVAKECGALTRLIVEYCGEVFDPDADYTVEGLNSMLNDDQPRPNYQDRVRKWVIAALGEGELNDRHQRACRFLEEALELGQAVGASASDAHQLVDYVFGRPVGETTQEVGGVMTTLAALCTALDIDMTNAGKSELVRCWEKIDTIRAKHFSKPKFGPLPGNPPVAL